MTKDYLHLRDTDILNFSDILSMIELYNKLKSSSDNKWENKKDKAQYIYSLLEKLLYHIWSPHTVNDYLLGFWINNIHINTSIISWLIMIRKVRINYIHCFSWDLNWDRWYMNKIVDGSIRQQILKLRNRYIKDSDKFIFDIVELDKTIATLLWEKYNFSIAFKNLKQS